MDEGGVLSIIHLMFSITYFAPYTNGARVQHFHTLDDARRMVDFYRSCGARAYLN